MVLSGVQVIAHGVQGVQSVLAGICSHALDATHSGFKLVGTQEQAGHFNSIWNYVAKRNQTGQNT